MEIAVAFYRWWPGAVDAPESAFTSAPTGADVASGARIVAWSTLGEGFDLAVALESAGSLEGTSARALAAALAIVRGELVDAGDGWHFAEPHGSAEGDDSVFAGIRRAQGLQLLRAMDGWDLLGLPDREAWVTWAMAFLRRGVYQRVPHDGAWYSADVNDLATLVLDTHHAEDVEGTSHTYDVPCANIRSWADAAQVPAGKDTRYSDSLWLSDRLKNAAILRVDAEPADLESQAAFQRLLQRQFMAGSVPLFVPGG